MLRRIEAPRAVGFREEPPAPVEVQDAEAAGRRGEVRGLQRLLHALQGLRPGPRPRPDASGTSAGSGRRRSSRSPASAFVFTIGGLRDALRHDLGADDRALLVPEEAVLGLRPVLGHPDLDRLSSTSSRHGYATKMYGGEVHDMGIALLYFTPAFYCDTTDSLLFPSKWQRLWVTVAGIYIEADPLHDRDGALGGELPRHAPPRAGLQDDALHGRLDGLLQHQPAHQDRRVLRALQPHSRSRSCGRSRSAGSARSSSATFSA